MAVQYFAVHMNNKQHQTNRGIAFLLFAVLFTSASMLAVFMVGRGAYEALAQYRTLEDSKTSFFAADAAIEDAIYRARKGMSYSASESYTFDAVPITVTKTTALDTAEFVAEAITNTFYRTSYASLTVGSGASFNFGLQSSTGGITLQNSSAVIGNVYSNGSVVGSGSNMIYGDVVSAGPSGFITGIHATSSVWAHTVDGPLEVDGDAYYQTLVPTVTVHGTPFPGSPDQPVADLPIDDATIEDWKTEAEAGGTLPLASCSGGTAAGNYTLNSDSSIGPLKIPCNLIISGNNTEVSLTGSLWVEGNVTFSNGPTLQVDAGFPNTSMVVVADKESNHLTSSKIISQGLTGFLGAAGSSYVLMISMNSSASQGGPEVAIDVDNNTPAAEKDVIYYAPYGKILGRNSLKLRGATAYNITLQNSATVEYETGMVSLLFSGGPGGSYVINDWEEIQ